MKKWLNIILIFLIILIVVLLSVLIYKDYLLQKKIKNAIIDIQLIDDLDITFNSNIKVSDLIKNINGNIVNDYKIDTDVLGNKRIDFFYINEQGIKIPYSININVIDDIPPLISIGTTYSVKVGYNKNLLDVILCGDNYDDNPTCTIKGDFDLNKVGKYSLVYEAIDSSGNISKKNFTLNVYKPSNNGNNSSSSKKVYFSDIYKEYKRNNTKVGIDVSKWQGKIDYEKVKNAGVEFAFIKLGGTNGFGGDYYIDSKFEENIEGFTRVGIPVGVYFYSYADSKEKAFIDALWVISKLKNYKIDLPVAYDWENWSSYNKFNLSFYNLTENARTFINTIEKFGYKSILYSSKSYLENIWLNYNEPVWLAHYTSKTNYKGKYNFWQMTSSGIVDGIKDNTVDINIMYE